jgi:signal transduction histidine kinase
VTPAPSAVAPGRRLQTRIFVLIGVGVVGPLVALGLAGWTSLAALRALVEEERRLLATSFAEHLDDVVRGNLELLQGVATAPGVDPADGDPGPERAALRAVLARAHLLQRAFVLDRGGVPVAQEPAETPRVELAGEALEVARATLATGRPMVSPLVTRAPRAHHLYLFVPVRNWRGEMAGAVGGEIDAAAPTFTALLRPFRGSRGGAIDLVDAQGLVIAATEEARRFAPSEVSAAALDRSRAAAGAAAPLSGPGGAVIAPLGTAPWTVVVRERDDEEAHVLGRFRRRLLALIPLLVGIGGLFAWGAARSVTRPLIVLTAAAERIRSGEWSEPIPPLGRDEVGRLGAALEAMRAALVRSIDEVARANAELEARVEERTRELERLYRELRHRDETRGHLLNKVISAQEEERKRIARELHDETSQTLSALAMRLEAACVDAPTEAVRQRLADARALAVRALDELHRLIYDLRPSILDDLGLVPAIRWFAARHLEPRGVAVRCECQEIDRRFPPEFEVTVFRVVQEAITNIAKHAGAETVLVECALEGGALVIDVEDDGCGFDPAAVATSAESGRGLGLLGMRERVELLGGVLRVDSAPGRGTHVSVRVPVPTEGDRGQDPGAHRG